MSADPKPKQINLDTASVLAVIFILVAVGFIVGRYSRTIEHVPQRPPAYAVPTQVAAR